MGVKSFEMKWIIKFLRTQFWFSRDTDEKLRAYAAVIAKHYAREVCYGGDILSLTEAVKEANERADSYLKRCWDIEEKYTQLEKNQKEGIDAQLIALKDLIQAKEKVIEGLTRTSEQK